MENQIHTDLRYNVYIDSIKDEASKKLIIMFLANVIKHIQLEDIISGISSLPFKVVNAVTEETAVKLQERLGVRGAVVRLVQLVPGNVQNTGTQNLSFTVLQAESTQTASSAPHNDKNDTSVQPGVQTGKQEAQPKPHFLKRMWHSWVDVMFNAQEFFKGIDEEKQLHFPVIFALVWGTIALMLNMPTVLYTQQTYLKFLAGTMPEQLTLPVSTYASILFIAPFFLFITLFIMAGIYHLGALLVGAKGGFGSTLKVITYSTGAMVLEVIPFLGIPLFWFYTLYLYTVGFRELHKVSTARAFVISILPLIVLFLFIFIMAAIIIFGFGMSFLRQFRPQIPGIPI